MNIFSEKLREVVLSVLPITIIALVFHFTLTPLGPFKKILHVMGVSFFSISARSSRFTMAGTSTFNTLVTLFRY